MFTPATPGISFDKAELPVSGKMRKLIVGRLILSLHLLTKMEWWCTFLLSWSWIGQIGCGFLTFLFSTRAPTHFSPLDGVVCRVGESWDASNEAQRWHAGYKCFR